MSLGPINEASVADAWNAGVGSSPKGGILMRDLFHDLADQISDLLEGNEAFTLSYGGEDSDFLRFNHGEVRQAGAVRQGYAYLDLMDGARHAGGQMTLSGDSSVDGARAKALVKQLRERRRFVPEDPYLLFAESDETRARVAGDTVPESKEALARIREAGRGQDLVGVYASGVIERGFASSFGQRDWHQVSSFHLDWSFYHRADKAVKCDYAGIAWDQDEFQSKVDWSKQQLEVLLQPSQKISPGRYRTYLSPAALQELLRLVGGSGFSERARRLKQTSLLRMVDEGMELHSSVNLSENVADGLAPGFQESGFSRPDQVSLVQGGALQDSLVSPRSSKEYGIPTNGASSFETPQALDLGAGSLRDREILASIDRGIYVNNLFYLNYSDRPACRATGMTRFATFWVEDGRIQAPLDVMRFDDTIYRILGENLVGLTQERELRIEAGTYQGRSVSSVRLPGALVDEFTLTL